MKVLLTQTLERIGIVGEVMEVSDGFARNYLLPKGLAVQPTDGNIKRLESARKDYEAKVAEARAAREKLLAALTGVEVSLTRAANDEGHLFGSVSNRDIAEELQKLGHVVQPDDVRLEAPIRRVDTFTVTVQLAGDLKTDIKVWVVREKGEAAIAAAAAAAAAAAPPETPETPAEEDAEA
jgi:large subunit ribosomal protein L9